MSEPPPSSESAAESLERSRLVARLAAAASHDFNNVLFAVGGQLRVVADRTKDPETAAALRELESILAGTSELVAVLVHAERGELELPRAVDLVAAVTESLRIAERLVPKSMRIEAAIAPFPRGAPAIRSTPLGVRQLLLNLALNARDATEGRGRVRCTLRPSPSAADRVVELLVEDDGPGMDPVLAGTALEAYVSTKGRGSGLGLSICRRIVEHAGGSIALDRSPDLGGLRVAMSLPTVEREIPEESPEAPQRRDADDPLDRIGMVLIVEDEPAIRGILREAFATRDIEVLERGDAIDLEATAIDGPVRLDLIVLDIDLPKRSGLDALRGLRARGARTPCVVITGGATELDPTLAPATLLRKPFRLDGLFDASRKVLARALT